MRMKRGLAISGFHVYVRQFTPWSTFYFDRSLKTDSSFLLDFLPMVLPMTLTVEYSLDGLTIWVVSLVLTDRMLAL